MALTIIVTDAGRAALVNAANTGTAPVTITEVGISATAVVPDRTAIVLPDEIKRIATLSGDIVADDTIHLIVRDESNEDFTVRSFALYFEDGTLFAIYGQAAVILEKSPQAMMLLAIDVQFADVDAAELTFGDANFLNPPATNEVQGVVELATVGEAQAGIDALRALTPAAAKAAILGWLLAQDGAGSGLDADMLDGQHGSYYLAASGYNATDILAKLVTVDGSGSGLDADLLDGQHGSYYADIIGRLGYTPANKAGDTFTGPIFLTRTGGNAELTLNCIGAVVTRLAAQTDGNVVLYRNNGSGDTVIWGINSNSGPFNFYVPITVGGNIGWHAGNDGSGSGLDADMLDGLHAGDFLRQLAGSNAQNGYMRLSNGLIFQWGRWTSSAGAGFPVEVSFPVSFSTEPYTLLLLPVVTDSATISVWSSDGISGSSFPGRCSRASIGCRFLAIGPA